MTKMRLLVLTLAAAALMGCSTGPRVATRVAPTQVAVARVRGDVRVESGEAIGGDGDFPARDAVAKLRKQRGAILACYEVLLEHNPRLAGRVVVEFTIESGGPVTFADRPSEPRSAGVHDVRASENTTGDPAVAACVTDAVSPLRWSPGPEGGEIEFRFPFAFSPQTP